MKKWLYCWIFLGFWVLGLPVVSQHNRTVVVLSMDAFRWDYLTMYSTPVLDSLARNGVSARFVPCFPSLTFPNHYSMATGLHPDEHGLVHNSFWDKDLGESYKIANRLAVEDSRFYGGEPIWVTAEKQGVRSASCFWVGSETSIGGYQPKDWYRYDAKVGFEARCDTVLSWLARPDSIRPRLILFYFQEPDGVSHEFTPQSNETRVMVQQLDTLIGKFLAQMRQLKNVDPIDFIVVSDHGMATYYPENYINLSDYVDIHRFKVITSGPVINLYPDAEYLDTAYEILKKIPRIQVWKRNEIPSRFRYGANGRVGDLLVLANLGTYVDFSIASNPRLGAAHGYDPVHEEMHGVFIGSGPSFRSNMQYEPMLNLNLYLILARLLELKPAPQSGDSVCIQSMLAPR